MDASFPTYVAALEKKLHFIGLSVLTIGVSAFFLLCLYVNKNTVNALFRFFLCIFLTIQNGLDDCIFFFPSVLSSFSFPMY